MMQAIPGYEGLYEFDENGRIFDKMAEQFVIPVMGPQGKFVRLWKGGEAKEVLIADLPHPPVPSPTGEGEKKAAPPAEKQVRYGGEWKADDGQPAAEDEEEEASPPGSPSRTERGSISGGRRK